MHVSYCLSKSVQYLLFRKINGKYKFSALISLLRLGIFHTLISLFLKGDTQMLGNLCIAWKPCYPSFHVFRFLSHSDIGFRCQTQSIFFSSRVSTLCTSGILWPALPKSRKVTKMVHKLSKENKSGYLHVE